MYEMFSKVYDEMVESENVRAYERIKWFLEKHNFNGEYIIELACGTGNMALKFAEDGYMVYATDISGSMIEKAKRKNKYDNCRFEVKDMRYVHTKEKADMVYCVLDGMSYISDKNEIKEIIKNVSSMLKKDGYFIFDFISFDSYEKIYKVLDVEQKYVDINDRNTIFWTEEYEKNKIEVSMLIYEKCKNNRFKVYKEVQEQYMHNDKDILEYVNNCFDIEEMKTEDIRTTIYCRKR